VTVLGFNGALKMLLPNMVQGRIQEGIKGVIFQELPKLDLTTDAGYVANLVMCGCKRAIVQFTTGSIAQRKSAGI